MIKFNKILVGYSTNRNEVFIKKFNKEIKNSILCDHEIIPFFNDGSYSLTQAYNKIWNDVKDTNNTIFVFLHHDIRFKTRGWGKNLINIFNNYEVDIIGLAGSSVLHKHRIWWLDEKGNFNKYDLWGKMWHTDGKKEWKSDYTTPMKKCKKIQPVVVVDGVFLAFNPNSCEKFNENIDKFHFYDISFCIENFLKGKKIAVTETITITHESVGNLSLEWEENRQKIKTIYPDEILKI